MKQLAMKAYVNDIPTKEVTLPSGYKFINFTGVEEDYASWKKIVVEPPVPPFDGDEYWRMAIDVYSDLDLVLEKDMFFVINDKGERVATVTTITHANNTGYLHRVKMLSSERGKGIGQAIANFSIEEFRRRNINEVYLTTDDFRVPAVKTYLKAGYRPIIYTDPESNMLERWEKLYSDINYPKSEYVYEEFKHYREIRDGKN